MPLIKTPKGASKEERARIIAQNIRSEEKAGKPHKQAVAISLETDRKSRKRAGEMNKETAVSIVALLELMDRVERYPHETVFKEAINFLTKSLEKSDVGKEESRKYERRWIKKHSHRSIGGVKKYIEANYFFD